MPAGDLNEMVAIERPVAAQNGLGGTEAGWEEVSRGWAHYRWLRGGEAVMQGRLRGRQAVVVTLRRVQSLSSVQADWRLRDLRTGTLFNVRSIVRTDDRMFLELTCETGVAT